MNNKIIILNNKKCQFITEDTTLFNKIRLFLSYKLENAQYSAAYQNGWDGRTFLMTPKGMFHLGLLKITQERILELGQGVEVEDRRLPLIKAPELDISQKLININKVPRDHQIRALEAAINNQKGIIRMATGSGKSLVSTLIAAKLNKPTIVYVIGIDLLQQFHDLFSSIFDEEIGFIGAGRCEVKRINICSIWTIGKALNLKDKEIIEDEEIDKEDFKEENRLKILNMLKLTKVHMFDECHTITCNTIKSIYNEIDPQHIYGFSGTPFRDSGDDLLINGILGEQIINVSASELIEKGLLVQPIIKFVPVPKMKASVANYHSVYKEYIVENPNRNALILKETKALVDKGYKVLVLFKQINHGKILSKLFNNNNINHEMLYGNDNLEKRNEVKEMINEGEIDVILASTIFDIGVDISILNALVLCSSGKSSIRTLQRIGRVIRSHAAKKFVAVVEFFDQIKYLKSHSLRRHEIYCSENGFKVYKCKGM